MGELGLDTSATGEVWGQEEGGQVERGWGGMLACIAPNYYWVQLWQTRVHGQLCVCELMYVRPHAQATDSMSALGSRPASFS